MNPILQAMQAANGNNLNATLNMIKSVIGNDPQAAMQNLLRTNPKFRQFYEENKGKPIEDVARAYGIDPAVLSQFIRK